VWPTLWSRFTESLTEEEATYRAIYKGAGGGGSGEQEAVVTRAGCHISWARLDPLHLSVALPPLREEIFLFLPSGPWEACKEQGWQWVERQASQCLHGQLRSVGEHSLLTSQNECQAAWRLDEAGKLLFLVTAVVQPFWKKREITQDLKVFRTARCGGACLYFQLLGRQR
jgi:hypothetical protein